MAECCDPFIIPPCVNRCDKLVDACCVIDQQPLDCIFEPVITTAIGTSGQTSIIVADTTGIEVGVLATGAGIGVDALVTAISGLTVTLSVANTAAIPGAGSGTITFHLINNRQCDINAAVNEALCNGTPCNTWTDLTQANLGLSSNALPLGGDWQNPAYSNSLGCIIHLVGVIELHRDGLAAGAALLVGTLPVGSRPTADRQFTINVDIPGSVLPTANFLFIDASTGQMAILNPVSTLQDPEDFVISLDGIYFHTSIIP